MSTLSPLELEVEGYETLWNKGTDGVSKRMLALGSSIGEIHYRGTWTVDHRILDRIESGEVTVSPEAWEFILGVAARSDYTDALSSRDYLHDAVDLPPTGGNEPVPIEVWDRNSWWQEDEK